jgi:hypothetical protein
MGPGDSASIEAAITEAYETIETSEAAIEAVVDEIEQGESGD